MGEEIKSMPMTKYIVLKKTSEKLPRGHWTYIALIDRNINKAHWWTIDYAQAFKFTSKKAADAKAKSLKYGPCRVIPASQFDEFVGREFWKIKVNASLTNEIRAKENEWHDDDWYEGINDD